MDSAVWVPAFAGTTIFVPSLFRMRSQHSRPKQLPPSPRLFAGEHELAVAAIMNRLWKFGRGRDMRLHHLEDEHIVFLDPAGVRKPALEIGIAFPDQWGAHMCADFGREAKFGKLVDVAPGAVADSDHGRCKVRRRQIDHALPAFAD